MREILLIGLPEETARALADRLVRQAPVIRVPSGQEALPLLAAGTIRLAVINCHLSDMTGEELLGRIRNCPQCREIPLIYCLAGGSGGSLPGRLVGQFGVSRLVVHPLDVGDLCEEIARELGLPVPDSQSAQQQPAGPVMAVWERVRDRVLARVTLVENACQTLGAGLRDETLRTQAEQEAHKLAGALGTFGFIAGSDLARGIEHLLQAGLPMEPARGRRLAEMAGALARQLQEPCSPPPDEPAEPDGPRLHILLVDDDRELCDRLAAEAGHWDARTEAAYSVASAREAIARHRPDVVVLDLSFSDWEDSGYVLLRELCAATPPVPTVVLTASGGLTDRVEVARLGGRCFLEKPVPPSQVMEAVMNTVSERSAQRAKVLAVDDDPSQLAVLRALLAPLGLELATLTDPLRFWDTVERVVPDMLVLDVEMPHISGLELCRVIRNDPRWRTLPILFLTASSGPAAIHRVFAAGGDDFVGKPIVGPELVTRILNRLERTQLLQKLADSDPLTGVGNRRHLNRSLQQFLKLAERQGQPVSLGIIDLDHFKAVNDEHGHTMGDMVLRRLGELLLKTFRGEDVVARWGGEEFALGMYGMARRHGVHRLAEVLETLRSEEFISPTGQPFRVSFSGGVAEFPRDGKDLLTLTRAADNALYRAKATGRSRILPAGREECICIGTDVLLVLGDPEAAARVEQAFVTRGYAVALFPDVPGALAWLRGLPPERSGRLLVLDADLPDCATLLQEGQARGLRLLAVPKPLDVGALILWARKQEDAGPAAGESVGGAHI